MSQDRRLIDSIKASFARNSLARLREIARATDRGRWTAEATAAANELLRDRLAGRAPEPEFPDDIDRPPELTSNPGALALGVLGGLLTGALVIPYIGRTEAPDLPVPFGHDMAWLCVRGTDTAAVARAMPVYEARTATWGDGIEAAHAGAVYISPPVAEWTFAVGTPFFQPPEQTSAGVAPLLERLSREFGEAQYFAHHTEFGLCAWGRATEGRLERGYGWLAARGVTFWDVGPPTAEEDGLGFRFVAGQPPQAETDVPDELVPLPDDGVLHLAALWSLDPSTLDAEFKEPNSGLLGTLTPPEQSPWRSPR